MYRLKWNKSRVAIIGMDNIHNVKTEYSSTMLNVTSDQWNKAKEINDPLCEKSSMEFLDGIANESNKLRQIGFYEILWKTL